MLFWDIYEPEKEKAVPQQSVAAKKRPPITNEEPEEVPEETSEEVEEEAEEASESEEEDGIQE